ncbi:hypothetical protein D0812_01020 [Vibrio owensii]|uniref:Uncharacterized protein n=1 Tax=Vibrio owensii TaxID=696485 RepID=A0AAP9K8R2_9VIBR|nr:hypothetical protein D0812_01020 [Vibrio owensii]QGH45789.1 hypothetical protein APZ19_01000 [Vibrio owensii]
MNEVAQSLPELYDLFEYRLYTKQKCPQMWAFMMRLAKAYCRPSFFSR